MTKYQMFPRLREDEFSALKSDIEKRGVQIPVEVDTDGNILDGHHRAEIAEELGIEYPEKVREFTTEAEKVDHVIKLNMARRHLEPYEWGQAFKRLLAERGVKTGQGSRNDSTSATVAEVAAELGVPERTARHRMGLADDFESLPQKYREAVVSQETTIQDAVRGIQGPPALPYTAHVANNSGENEWYTPSEYIESARLVMGSIDLDPASNETANSTVKATAFFNAEDDGLSKAWVGNIWMNPPYAQPLIAQFSDKVSTENITQACVLVNNATETKWFQTIASKASAICFPAGRVKFWHPDRVSAPLQGQAVLYIGKNAKAFIAEFSKFGFCAKVGK